MKGLNDFLNENAGYITAIVFFLIGIAPIFGIGNYLYTAPFLVGSVILIRVECLRCLHEKPEETEPTETQELYDLIKKKVDHFEQCVLDDSPHGEILFNGEVFSYESAERVDRAISSVFYRYKGVEYRLFASGNMMYLTRYSIHDHPEDR